MKALLTALLVIAPLFAQAYTWTDSDTSTPVYVTTDTPYHYTFDLTSGSDPFVPGTDLITSYSLSFDLSSHGVFSFNMAALDQPGLAGDDVQMFLLFGDLQGSSAQGKAILNSSGQLDVTVYSLLGNFYIDSAYLEATGIKNSAGVPEPASVALLAAGMLGIVVMRRKRNA